MSFGVIALDVFITSTADYVKDLRLMDSGYGILLKSIRELVITPTADLIGARIDDLNNGAGN